MALKDDDEDFADFTQMRVKHINHTERLWAGNMTYFVNVGNDFDVETIIYKRIGGEYQQTPYKFPIRKFCDLVNTSLNYEDMRKVSNIPAIDVCPWPKVFVYTKNSIAILKNAFCHFKGTYEIYGYSFNFDRMPPYFEGDYMLDSRFYKHGEFLNGYILYGTVIET